MFNSLSGRHNEHEPAKVENHTQRFTSRLDIELGDNQVAQQLKAKILEARQWATPGNTMPEMDDLLLRVANEAVTQARQPSIPQMRSHSPEASRYYTSIIEWDTETILVKAIKGPIRLIDPKQDPDWPGLEAKLGNALDKLKTALGSKLRASEAFAELERAYIGLPLADREAEQGGMTSRRLTHARLFRN